MIGIGFGTWSWGNQLLWGYVPEKHDKSLEETFNTAINNGLRFIDTADSYGTGKLNGRSEKLLGKYISKLPEAKKKSIVIATKLAPYPWRLGRKGFNKAFQASKERLKNKIDRVQLHWSTSRYAPWQERQLLDNLADLYEKKEISEIGVSNMGPLRLKWVYDYLRHRGVPLKSVQIQFSLISPQQDINFQIKEICKELNIELIAYSPLALGVLSINPGKEILPNTFLLRSIFRRLLPVSYKLRSELYNIAKERNVSQVQVALNWCRSHEALPIAGIRSPSHAKDISRTLKWSLSRTERIKLDNLSNDIQIRMPNNPLQSL